jgi:hypothetical protein
LFVAAVESYEQRYGKFADSPWAKANFTPAPDCEPRMVADLIRDAHDAALRLIELVTAKSAKLQLELPRLPSKLLDWMEAARRLPAIPEDSLLGQVSAFTPGEILVAADLARMRLAIEDGSAHAIVQADPVAVGYLAQQADACGVVSQAPFEVVTRADKMTILTPSLLDGLKKISSLVAAFGPGTEPDVTAAAAMAEPCSSPRRYRPISTSFCGSRVRAMKTSCRTGRTGFACWRKPNARSMKSSSVTNAANGRRWKSCGLPRASLRRPACVRWRRSSPGSGRGRATCCGCWASGSTRPISSPTSKR